MTENRKSIAIRLKAELDDKIEEIRQLKEKETGVRLTRTQIIEMLVIAGLEKMREEGK